MDKGTINRQQAIDVLAIGEELLKRVLDDVDVVGYERKKYEWGLGLIEAYIADLKDLPPAQPEIIHCRDCKHHWTHSCMDAFPREICDLDQTFYDSNIDYCSLAERRTDE